MAAMNAMEKALDMGEAKYRELVEDSNSIILRLDRDGNVTFINKFARRFFGYTADEIVGENILRTIVPQSGSDGRDMEAMIGGLLQYPEGYRTNINENMRKNGERVWISWTNKAIYDRRGKLAGLLCVGNDITRLKQAEWELKEAKAQAELYLDLMGHDINNMNQVALGYLEVAGEVVRSGGTIDSRNSELIEKPAMSLESSSKLIDNVRKLQKIKAGQNKIEICPWDILEEACRQFSGMPGVSIDAPIPEARDVTVGADELLIDVFSNIIGNAVKHSGGRQDPRIVIRSSTMFENGKRYCKIAIEDNGPGIPDDRKGRIFKRLMRGDLKAKGSGLGLYIVNSLVESYGGRVWAEDRVPHDHTKGSRFVVMLPTTT